MNTTSLYKYCKQPKPINTIGVITQRDGYNLVVEPSTAFSIDGTVFDNRADFVKRAGVMAYNHWTKDIDQRLTIETYEGQRIVNLSDTEAVIDAVGIGFYIMYSQEGGAIKWWVDSDELGNENVQSPDSYIYYVVELLKSWGRGNTALCDVDKPENAMIGFLSVLFDNQGSVPRPMCRKI